jgi:hypothetical protein
MGGGMNFAEILSRLGERGEKGELPRPVRQERSPRAGLISPDEAKVGEQLAPLARRSPRAETSPDMAFSPISPVSPGKGKNSEMVGAGGADISIPYPHADRATCALVAGSTALVADFRLVSTWWQWSPQDVEGFQTWARQHHEDAAAWVHAEAEKVRHYRDHLHADCISTFIGDKHE